MNASSAAAWAPPASDHGGRPPSFDAWRVGDWLLAERALLDDADTAALLQRPRDPGLAPYARERAQLDADAVLDALAERERAAKNK